MYDVDGHGTITKDEFEQVLVMMIGAHISPEQVSGIAERTMKEADADGDGEITFEEFCKVSLEQCSIYFTTILTIFPF
jgi:calcineurin B family protein 1